MSVTGERDDIGGGPQKVGVAVADLFTGMYATVAILAALRHAERTGEGQHVDAGPARYAGGHAGQPGRQLPGQRQGAPGRAGNAHQNIVPYQVFEVARAAEGNTKDHLILAVGNDGQYAKFCAVAGRPELASDPRYARNQDRVRNRPGTGTPAASHHAHPYQGRHGWPHWRPPRCPAGPSTIMAEVFRRPPSTARAAW
jgi:crotonobetainyl-CoA:carnitine CoA-transferase CaiB-like acyl-CoA transferase